MTTIASWTLDGTDEHNEQLLTWLAKTQPDVVALQGPSAHALSLPKPALVELGYSVLCPSVGRGSSVALLSRGNVPEQEQNRLSGWSKNEPSSYLKAAVRGMRVISVNAPSARSEDDFARALDWLNCLEQRLAVLKQRQWQIVVAGNFGCAPAELDVQNFPKFRFEPFTQIEPRVALSKLIKAGWSDVLRSKYPDRLLYTSWHASDRLEGVRLNLMLLNGKPKKGDVACDVDMEEQGSTAPVWLEI